MKKNRVFENVVHGIFLLLGLITVGCVLLITVYLVISGIPAIKEIGLVKFLFGKEWASTAAEPKFGILPFILTSVYGTAGAILIGVPVGFFTAVFLSKVAGKKVRSAMETAVSLLAGIPSVVYGLVGMLVLVPAVRSIFHVPDGASLLAAIIVLAIMILPSIIKVSGRVSGGDVLQGVCTRCKERHCRSGGAGRGPRHWRGHGRDDGSGQCGQYAQPVPKRAFPDYGGGQRDVLFQPRQPAAQRPVLHCIGAVPVHYASECGAEFLSEAG